MQTTITLRVTDIMTEVVQKVRRSKTASTNMADKINQTNSSKPTTISEHFLCNNHLTCNLFLLNSFNLTVTVYEKQEKHTSLKGVKPLNLMVFIRQIKLSTVLSMFKSFVLFIAAHYYFAGCNVFPYF